MIGETKSNLRSKLKLCILKEMSSNFNMIGKTTSNFLVA